MYSVFAKKYMGHISLYWGADMERSKVEVCTLDGEVGAADVVDISTSVDFPACADGKRQLYQQQVRVK